MKQLIYKYSSHLSSSAEKGKDNEYFEGDGDGFNEFFLNIPMSAESEKYDVLDVELKRRSPDEVCVA